MAILSYVHHMYPSRFQKLFKATFNERITRQVMREEMVFSHRASWLLLIISAIALSLIGSLVINEFSEVTWNSGVAFFTVFFGLCLWVMFRQITRSVIALLAEKDLGLREFNFVSALIYKVLGLILLPICLVMAFSSAQVGGIMKYLVLTLLLVAMAFRLFRGFKIGRYYTGSMYYMIVYLCALELIPTLIVVRAIVANV